MEKPRGCKNRDSIHKIQARGDRMGLMVMPFCYIRKIN